MKKFVLTALAISLLSACSPKTDKTTDTKTTASSVASTVVTTASPASAVAPVMASGTAPAIVASTVVIASAPQPVASAVVVPTGDTKSTADAPVAPTAQPATAQTPLQTDLIALMGAIQHLEQNSQQKQAEMQQQLQTKIAKAKTPEQQQALQKTVVSDVIAYRTQQKNELANVPLTDKRVKSARDKMVESMTNDIKANKVILSHPAPTPEAQKEYANAMKQAQTSGDQARQQVQKLLAEAGMAKEPSATKPKK